MKTKLTLALTAALLLGASSALAAANDWIYTDNGSANRTPSIGVSDTWRGLFHWEYFTVFVQQKISHHFATAFILK